MANVNAPSGLSPVGTLTGAAYNEQGRLYAIANDASNTYAIGDIVKSAVGNDTNGVALITKATASDIPLGVIVGIRVADPGPSLVGTTLDLTKIYLGTSAGSYRYAYVVDDPAVIFQVQANASVDGKVGSTAVPTITADQTTLSPSSPLSSTYVTADASATAASMFQVLGVSQVQSNTVGAYNKVLVKFNKHQYANVFGA